MIIYIDIDNTICNTDGINYAESTPMYENIYKVKSLIGEGHDVSFWTARGTGSDLSSPEEWKSLTMEQLESWGLGGIPVIFGKPYFDLFIDDRVMNVKDWK